MPPAGEATNAGQEGARAPERVPPARPGPGVVCTCEHLDVLHNLTATGRRTACSVSTGPNATRCGCREFTSAVLQTEENPS
ncbi:hypothetical protein BJF79_03955 [Actinomadura sp. CNU-125]|nr:hypothetical protein BJF79_03955 [Actinomadura sp. CNU-125]